MKVKTMGKKMLTLKQINSKKREMYNMAKHYGLVHPSVVACSQELDRLLNKYQGIHQYDHVV
ncbi:aspartyl-phosphate phosphatase Spo0E family protein [Paenisporosarcina sp. TG-14]|uniref:aspartyl-phosphate phosphatase Spo0E family protein n=1 Tax=Paenisporosarcina sp. TG-14 TaxID=1231057 RepID=UPI0002F71EDF|nr:aspartyl-phosphate phosphatase Spo0E family protein [Paenisporosarcina sp. TG-14]